MIGFVTREAVEWLSGADNPVVRYLAARDFPDYSPVAALTAYEPMRKSPLVARIEKSVRNMVAGDVSRYEILYRGMVWCFAELVECGLTVNDSLVAKTAERIVQAVQLPTGGFTMNWMPPGGAAGWSGDILYYLTKSGYSDSSIHRAAEWIMSAQRPDGGWLTSPVRTTKDAVMLALFRHVPRPAEDDFSERSSLLSTIACARALSLYGKHHGGTARAVERAGDFILGKGLLAESNQQGGEIYLSNRRFTSLSYPILCQHDIISALDFLADENRLKDDRASIAFNLIMKKRGADGTFPCEAREAGTLHAKYRFRKNSPDKWVTLRVLRFLGKIDDPDLLK